MPPQSQTTPGGRPPPLERALALLQAGQPQAAVGCLEEARRLYPRDPQILYHLGNSLRLCGAIPQATEALEAAIGVDPGLADAWFSLAFLHIHAGHPEQAAAALKGLSDRSLEDTEIQRKAAALMAGFGQEAAAIPILERLAEREPKRAGPHQQLGILYQKLGRYDKAAEEFRKVIARDPHNGAAYMLLANTGHMSAADEPLTTLFTDALAKPGLDEDARSCIHFGLGKIYDDLKQYEPAFSHYRQANEIKHRQMHFDRDDWRDQVRRLMRVFSEMKPRHPAKAPASSPELGFVVGMVRSGTTLVERVLSASPQVQSRGETEALDAFVLRLSELKGVPYPECLLELEDDESQAIAADFLRQTSAGRKTATLILDKNPLNFMHLGLIRLLFPDAPIIHCRREPLDACLSVYLQNFAHARNSYAYDLGDIASFYAGYERLMSFWEISLPGRIIPIEYEKLAMDPESTARGLYEELHLDWTPEAILPQKNPTPISTASVWQARQPIYERSIGRWRNYTGHLSPLRDALVEYRALFQRL